MRIIKVELKDFQSHKKTTLDFHEKFNVIVGSSNAGKSAILRGIRWCLTNTPSGKDFVRKGAKSAKVRVTLNNGYTIERERGVSASLNYYRLFKGEDLIEEFTGFRTNVPELIQEVIGEPESFTYTFADQMEAAYLISESPRVRAERVGNLDNFTKLDVAIGSLKDDERELKATLRETTKKVGELEKNLTETEKELSEVSPILDLLDSTHEYVTKNQRSLERLKVLLESSKNVSEELPLLQAKVELSDTLTYAFGNLDETYSDYLKLGKMLSDIKNVNEQLSSVPKVDDEVVLKGGEQIPVIEEDIQKYMKLRKISTDLSSNIKEIKELKSRNLIDIDFEEEFTSIERDILRFKELNQINKKIDEYSTELEKANAASEHSIRESERLLDEFMDLIHELNVCPTCFQDTSGVDKDTIKENL